eukprot:6064530-Karenia_brevis.AAC.1
MPVEYTEDGPFPVSYANDILGNTDYVLTEVMVHSALAPGKYVLHSPKHFRAMVVDDTGITVYNHGKSEEVPFKQLQTWLEREEVDRMYTV